MSPCKKTNRRVDSKWLAIGIAVGTALGVAFGSLVIGISLGVAFGIIFGMRSCKSGDENDEKPE